MSNNKTPDSKWILITDCAQPIDWYEEMIGFILPITGGLLNTWETIDGEVFKEDATEVTLIVKDGLVYCYAYNSVFENSVEWEGHQLVATNNKSILEKYPKLLELKNPEAFKKEAYMFADDQVFDRNTFRDKLTEVGIAMAKYGYEKGLTKYAAQFQKTEQEERNYTIEDYRIIRHELERVMLSFESAIVRDKPINEEDIYKTVKWALQKTPSIGLK